MRYLLAGVCVTSCVRLRVTDFISRLRVCAHASECSFNARRGETYLAERANSARPVSSKFKRQQEQMEMTT